MKKNIISVVCCGFLLTNVAYADDESYAKKRAGINQGDVVDTREVVRNSKEKISEDEADNTFAVIYHHLQDYEQKHSKDVVMLRSIDFDGKDMTGVGYDFYAKQQSELQNAQILAQAENDKLNEKVSLFTGGYCVLKNKISIGRLAGYADLNCDLDISKKAVLKVALTPDFYTYSLIATPLYINLGGERFNINGGAVTNALRTSINVATRVDDFLVSRVIAETGVKTANVMTQYAQGYLDERKSYRESQNNKTNTNVIMNDKTAVVAENSTKENYPPRFSDYLGGALVDIVGSLMTAAGNAYLQTRTFAFEIDQDTIMYADLDIDMTRKALQGINFSPSNMIVRQPTTNFGSADSANSANYNRVGIGDLNFKNNTQGIVNSAGSVESAPQFAPPSPPNNQFNTNATNRRQNGVKVYSGVGYPNNGNVR